MPSKGAIAVQTTVEDLLLLLPKPVDLIPLLDVALLDPLKDILLVLQSFPWGLEFDDGGSPNIASSHRDVKSLHLLGQSLTGRIWFHFDWNCVSQS